MFYVKGLWRQIDDWEARYRRITSCFSQRCVERTEGQSHDERRQLSEVDLVEMDVSEVDITEVDLGSNGIEST